VYSVLHNALEWLAKNPDVTTTPVSPRKSRPNLTQLPLVRRVSSLRQQRVISLIKQVVSLVQQVVCLPRPASRLSPSSNRISLLEREFRLSSSESSPLLKRGVSLIKRGVSSSRGVSLSELEFRFSSGESSPLSSEAFPSSGGVSLSELESSSSSPSHSAYFPLDQRVPVLSHEFFPSFGKFSPSPPRVSSHESPSCPMSHPLVPAKFSPAPAISADRLNVPKRRQSRFLHLQRVFQGSYQIFHPLHVTVTAVLVVAILQAGIEDVLFGF